MKVLLKVSAIALLAASTGCASTQPSMPKFDLGSSLKMSQGGHAHSAKDADMKLAAAALAGGDRAGAIRIYRRVAQTHPMALEPRLALGEALLAADAAQEASRAFKGAAKLDNKSFSAVAGLARSQLALRQPAEALRLFDKAIRLEPMDTLARNGKAVALDQLGRHREAQDIYLDLLDADPTNMKVRSNYGLSLALEGREDEAADVLASLSAAPDAEPRIRQNLALAYGLAGNDGQAAHVSRLDLDEDAVQNNIAFFQRLRNVSGAVNRVAAFSKPSRSAVAPSFKRPVSDETGMETQTDENWSGDAWDEMQEWGESRVIDEAPVTPLHSEAYAGGLVVSEDVAAQDVHSEGAEPVESPALTGETGAVLGEAPPAVSQLTVASVESPAREPAVPPIP